MSFTQLLTDYGYLAVFIGCLLEGETILVLAGFAAHQGHLSLPVTLTIAFVGGALGDQVFFWIGRTWGLALRRRFASLDQRARVVTDLLQRYDAPLIVGIRFMYGLRIVGPIAIGASRVPPGRFALFNLLGAAIWAPLIGGLGYLFGQGLELVLGDIERFEGLAFGIVGAAVLLFSLLRGWFRSRSKG
jgi:membrane protein DedA with SNARE-associated domain